MGTQMLVITDGSKDKAEALAKQLGMGQCTPRTCPTARYCRVVGRPGRGASSLRCRPSTRTMGAMNLRNEEEEEEGLFKADAVNEEEEGLYIVYNDITNDRR